ncbi:hypothetical protein NDU88_006296 [Pleurodeles waltl]|uniref:Uncharacterized protein n=1 Tax=Pleurodeles waltl TaxID=8319 RepID=A0AAV7LQG3_PLEWA|nr:hypothetical protein NDU88_006296 [Pleurodeles waltl]
MWTRLGGHRVPVHLSCCLFYRSRRATALDLGEFGVAHMPQEEAMAGPSVVCQKLMGDHSTAGKTRSGATSSALPMRMSWAAPSFYGKKDRCAGLAECYGGYGTGHVDTAHQPRTVEFNGNMIMVIASPSWVRVEDSLGETMVSYDKDWLEEGEVQNQEAPVKSRGPTNVLLFSV